MSKNVLTEEQREELKERHKIERDGRIRDRIQAVLMYDDGYSNVEIAKVLLLSHEAIRKHIVDYQKANKLHTDHGGSTSKLSYAQQTELAIHLEANNYVYAKDIMHHIENSYGVRYTIAGVTKLLYKLGFVYKKPKVVPAKLDHDKQELCKLNYSLLKGNLRDQEVIYFIDVVYTQYQARARCGWIRRNPDKTLPTFSGWRRKYMIGAINLDDLQLVRTEHLKINGEQIVNLHLPIAPQVKVSDVVRTIKSITGRLLNKRFEYMRKAYWGIDGI